MSGSGSMGGTDGQSTIAEKLQDETSGLKQKISEMVSERENMNARLIELELQLADSKSEYLNASKELNSLSREFLVTYGSVREAGKRMGVLSRQRAAFFKFLREHQDELKKSSNDSELNVKAERDYQVIYGELNNLGALFNGIEHMDSNPEEAAEFETALYESMYELSKEESSLIQSKLEEGYKKALKMGLNTAAEPDENIEQWKMKHQALYEEYKNQVFELLPDHIKHDEFFPKDFTVEGVRFNLWDGESFKERMNH